MTRGDRRIRTMQQDFRPECELLHVRRRPIVGVEDPVRFNSEVTVIARISVVLFALFSMQAVVFAQVPTMRPSNGPLDRMLVIGAGAHIGNKFPAILVRRTPTLGWGPAQVGQYVAIREGRYALTVASPVGDRQQVAIEAYTGADTQLSMATNVIGVLWTFAPKLAPHLSCKRRAAGCLSIHRLLWARGRQSPVGVGVIPGQMWVYPKSDFSTITRRDAGKRRMQLPPGCDCGRFDQRARERSTLAGATPHRTSRNCSLASMLSTSATGRGGLKR